MTHRSPTPPAWLAASILLLVVLFWASLSLAAVGIQTAEPSPGGRQLVVRLHDGVSVMLPAPVRQPFPGHDGLDDIWYIKPPVADATVQALRDDPRVAYVEWSQPVHVLLTPDDPYYWTVGSWGQAFPDLYGILNTNCAAAWDLTTGGDVVVAVIDTGVDYTHPDIIANILVDADGVVGYDFYHNDPDPIDDHGHGTHCAGTIAGVGNNGLGVVGVNWTAKIMPIKFLGASGSGWSSDAAEAIVWATDHGARVMSNSWGSSGYSDVLHDAITYAHDHNVVFVAAAGNSNTWADNFQPAADPGAICVSAFDYADKKASFSNYGAPVDVAAPGVEVLSLRAAGTDMYGDGSHTVGVDYMYASGTSMACPHVAGLAALVLSARPELNNEQVRQVVRRGADDVATVGWDIYSGYGRINALGALLADTPSDCRITALERSGPEQTLVTISGTAAGAAFASFDVAYVVGRYPQGNWMTINTSAVPVVDGVLGTLDLATLPEPRETYTFRLRVHETTGESILDYRTLVGQGHLYGRVTDGATGLPLPGVEVTAYYWPGDPADAVVLYTDENGEYDYGYVESGYYRMYASLAGYLQGDHLTYLTPNSAEYLRFILTPEALTGSIYGHAECHYTGDPFAGWIVVADQYFHDYKTWYTVTDEFGNFRLDGLLIADDYRVWMKRPGTPCGADTLRFGVSVGPGQELRYDFWGGPYERMATLYGRVCAAEEAPCNKRIPGALVEAFYGGERQAWVLTGSEDSGSSKGGFVMDIPEDTYEIHVSAIGRQTLVETMTLVAGQPVERAFSLEPLPAPSGSIGGIVADANSAAPLEGVRVDAKTGVFYFTDGEGRYLVPDLAPGPRDVRFSLDGYFAQTFYAVPVLSGETTNLDVKLAAIPPPPIGTIVGIVRDEAGKPVRGARVSAWGLDKSMTRTAADGSYEFRDIPAGNYVVAAAYRGAKDDAPAALEPQATVTVDLTLKKK